MARAAFGVVVGEPSARRKIYILVNSKLCDSKSYCPQNFLFFFAGMWYTCKNFIPKGPVYSEIEISAPPLRFSRKWGQSFGVGTPCGT